MISNLEKLEKLIHLRDKTCTEYKLAAKEYNSKTRGYVNANPSYCYGSLKKVVDEYKERVKNRKVHHLGNSLYIDSDLKNIAQNIKKM